MPAAAGAGTAGLGLGALTLVTEGVVLDSGGGGAGSVGGVGGVGGALGSNGGGGTYSPAKVPPATQSSSLFGAVPGAGKVLAGTATGVFSPGASAAGAGGVAAGAGPGGGGLGPAAGPGGVAHQLQELFALTEKTGSLMYMVSNYCSPTLFPSPP